MHPRERTHEFFDFARLHVAVSILIQSENHLCYLVTACPVGHAYYSWSWESYLFFLPGGFSERLFCCLDSERLFCFPGCFFESLFSCLDRPIHLSQARIGR